MLVYHYKYFNPHSHEGSDYVSLFEIPETKVISIHTPTKGVTVQKTREGDPLTDFNPHSHEGSDNIVQAVARDLLAFQSTLPRRE